MSDAGRLRAQIPASTDKRRLARMARDVEVWNNAIEAAARVARADYPVHAKPDGYSPGIKGAIADAIRGLKR